MTFTEAAVEILRRAGKPLHFAQIAADAVAAGLLSHVGQTPEATMGARLVAIAKREHDRVVIATEAGVFALPEWGQPAATPALDTPPEPPADAPAYRSRERHPPLREEFTPGGRRDDRRRGRDEGDGRRRKYPPPADVAHSLLRERGEPLSLEALVQALRAKDRVAEALERDLASFERALREENRRREDAGRPPMFAFGDGGLVTGLELPREQPQRRPEREAPEARRERREEPRPVPGAAEEQRRQALRTVRRRLSSMDVAALERVAVALLEAQGYRELNMARRSSKEGPLYLARRRFGAVDWRCAVRVLRPGRDVGRAEVQELRRDLSHFSAQVGVVFGAAECSREAKGEANASGLAPVMLYGAEAFAEALVEAGLGVHKRMVEWVEFDDAFFSAAGAGEAPAEVEEKPVESGFSDVEPAPAPASSEPRREGERGRRGRDRDRRRERDEQRRREQAEAAPAAGDAQPPVPEAASATEPTIEPATSPATATEASAPPVEPAPAAEPVPDVITPAAEPTPAAGPASDGPTAAGTDG